MGDRGGSFIEMNVFCFYIINVIDKVTLTNIDMAPKRKYLVSHILIKRGAL